jgi:hypothetical protein
MRIENIAALAVNFADYARVWTQLDNVIRTNDAIAKELTRRFYAPAIGPQSYARSLVEIGASLNLTA